VLTNAVAGFFQNGGRRAYVVNPGAGARASIRAQDLALFDAVTDISLVLAPGYSDAASHAALITHCADRGDRFAILDMPRDIDPLERLTRAAGDGDGLRPAGDERGHAAVYVPWIEVADAITDERIALPPSGHLAGIYARVDATRGVHEAPANEPLIGALGLTRLISSAEQEVLHPVGINAIRRFPQGILVWGARTLADPQSEWKYVAVRRLMIMVEQSIAQGTQWVVFESNDETLWSRVRRDVGAFLDTVWRSGALLGATPREAYFVRADRTTMTQDDIDNGRLIVEVGVAPLRPAEFVIIRIMQRTSESTP
jgi:phage tail sheath protein FI